MEELWRSGAAGKDKSFAVVWTPSMISESSMAGPLVSVRNMGIKKMQLVCHLKGCFFLHSGDLSCINIGIHLEGEHSENIHSQ